MYIYTVHIYCQNICIQYEYIYIFVYVFCFIYVVQTDILSKSNPLFSSCVLFFLIRSCPQRTWHLAHTAASHMGHIPPSVINHSGPHVQLLSEWSNELERAVDRKQDCVPTPSPLPNIHCFFPFVNICLMIVYELCRYKYNFFLGVKQLGAKKINFSVIWEYMSYACLPFEAFCFFYSDV